MSPVNPVSPVSVGGPMSTVRTVAVRCHRWPIVAAGAVDRACAVMHANRVVAVSVLGEQSGVAVGMRKRDTQRRCPSIELIDNDPGRDARAFEPVVRALESIHPRIEITEPGVCAFGARGPARYFGGEALMAQRVQEVVCEVIGMGPAAVAVGVADGPFAAWLAALRQGSGVPGGSGVVGASAVGALAGGGGVGVSVVPAGGSAAYLAPMPIGALAGAVDDSINLVDVLTRLGLRTLGAFAVLPADDVLARFGWAGARAHALASGGDARLLDAQVPMPDLVVSTVVEPPAERVDIAAFAAKSLAQELHDGLSARGLACSQVLIHAQTANGEILERVWRHEGALSAAAVAERVRWQLDGWLNGAVGIRPSAGIALLKLVPEGIMADVGKQLGFWGGATAADERAVRAIARLSSLVGPDAVLVPERRGGRHPSNAVVLVRADSVDLEKRALAGPMVGCPWPGGLPLPSPTVLYSPGVAAEVVDTAGAVVGVSGRGAVSSAPARVLIGAGGAGGAGSAGRNGAGNAGGAGSNSRWRSVVGWAGPWPIDERWWDASAHLRRARFQVVLDGGAALLLVLERGRWTCEAAYE